MRMSRSRVTRLAVPVFAVALGGAMQSSALPGELRWFGARDEYEAAVRRHLQAGYRELAQDRPGAALAQFRTARRVDMTEQANMLPWVGEAEALCRLDRKADGRAVLADFNCAVDLQLRQRSCASLEAAPNLARSAPGFPARCYVELCVDWDVREQLKRAPTPHERRAAMGLRRLAQRIGTSCGR